MKDIWEDAQNYRIKKKSKINKKKLLIIIAVSLVILLLLILIILYNSVRGYREWVDINIFNKQVYQDSANTIEFQDENAKVCAFNNNIGVLSKNQFMIYNSSGNKETSIDMQITNPLFCSSSRYLAVAQKTGKKLYVLEDKKIKWETNVEGEISQVHINKNGYVAVVITGTSYKTVITVFDNSRKSII